MFEAILSPFRWLMSWLLGAFHSILEFAGLPTDSGWTWALSILLLVVLIRTLLIPLFVKQIKAQRAMQAIQPELQ
ncbi:YidC/Oxa1 family membrane protein insertase, partial [Mycobacterium tuberculosis]